MRDVRVKGLAIARVEMLREQLAQGMSSVPPPGGAAAAHAESLRGLTPAATGLGREELYKVTLQLEGATATGDSVDVWVGDQVVLGTVFHEREQMITGYVRHPPPEASQVRIRYSDGSYKTFAVDSR